jgi:SAM-dependent methyltransferase
VVASYRDRVYASYVTAVKGRIPAERLQLAYDEHARYFDHLFAGVTPRGKSVDVLEIACGSGYFLYWAAKQSFASVRGFDVSAEQIEVAREMGLPAEVASYRDYLPRHADSFDLLVGMDILEHLTRDESLEFLELCYLTLRPGGQLFITTPNGAGLRPGPVIYGDITHETMFTPRTVDVALRLVGFRDVEVAEIAPAPLSVRSRVRAALWKAIRLWPMLLDLVETGGASSKVYSRNMIVRARRPLDENG